MLFQLICQIMILAELWSPWAVFRKTHFSALLENKDNLLVVACDGFIVFDWACSGFGWLTCLSVIVWSGLCCASLKYMSVCSLLTCCRIASGSYMKSVCHKNTLHINLLGPLVETLALMNHDLCKNENLFTQKASCETLCPVLRELAGFSVQYWKKRLVLIEQSFIVLAVRWNQCVADRSARLDALSDVPHQQHRAELKSSTWPGHGWTQDHSHHGELQGAKTAEIQRL